MKKPVIARLPECNPGDEWCCICGDDNIVVVLDGQRAQGSTEIIMESISLCSKCLGQMKAEINELGI